MPLYTYEAANINGNVIKGKLSADNEEDLMRTLRKKGFFLKECSEASGKLDLDLAMFRKIPEKDLSVFCREIYFSLSSGISIMEALKIVKDQLENKKLRWVTERVYEDVEGGNLLSDAFKKTNEMPDLFIYMIEVGETTGSLDEIMNELSDYYDKQYKQGRKIANALIYPKFLIIFSLVIVSILVAYVVPIFVNNLLSANGELPIPTKIVITLSNVIKNYGIYILGIIILLAILKKVFLNKSSAYKLLRDKFIVKSKFVGKISMQIMTARFARTFSILYGGGISVISALDITSNVIGNVYLKDKLLDAKKLINNGSTIGDALDSERCFPSMLIQSIKVGEESGSIDKILKKASDFYDSEANFALERITALIEPTMIIILAGVVGFIVLSLILPMFSMYDAIN